jgi:hypothetical protein
VVTGARSMIEEPPMSNAPDDKRPESDVADQLAGTPAAETTPDTTPDAAAPAEHTSTERATAGHTPAEPAPATMATPIEEPAPLVEPERIDDREPIDASSVSTPSDATTGHAPAAGTPATGTDAAEAAPLPTGVMPPADPEPVVAPAPHAQPQTVYVTAPTAPRKKSNRGIGTLLAVLGTIAFALLHGMITAIAYVAAGRSFNLTAFITSSGFIVPTLTFLVVFVLAVLVINRAGWWAWVLGSLIVAVVTYLASIGIIMLLENVVAMTPAQAQDTWERLAMSAPMLIALVVAREVAVWFGAAIASRGRRVKARNLESRADYERELAENRARYGAVER